jgi:DNA gyrase subunit A
MADDTTNTENNTPDENVENVSTAVDAEVLARAQEHSRIVESRTVENVMEDSYLRYSMSVIVERALPDVRDGLKPVHRRILYSMEKNGWRPGSKFVKSARVVGDVIGKYHPHGDTAIYDSMVRLAQEWSMRYMLVNGQGNFGSMDGDPAAAMRYTEAKMERIAEELVSDLNKDTVDFRDNFDGSEQEPSVLPGKLPNLLLNGQLGIAVGMATNIPPHNLGELLDATIHQIDNPEATVDDLLEYVQGPDFPTGGIIYGKESMRAAYATGRGGIVVRGVAEIIEDAKGKQQILISEIPYGLNKASLIEKIADLHKEKKILGLADLRDESSRGKVKIVIDLKRDAFPKKLLNQLFKLTQLQSSFNFNMMALIDGIQPRVLGLQDIIQEHIKHRQVVVRRRTEYELKKAKDRAHILEGLKIALDNIDEVIATIRASQTTEEAQENLMKKFKLSELQAKAILAMQLRALAGLERQRIEDELAELKALIEKLETILADEKKILKIIKDEFKELKEKFADERRTKVVPQELGKMSDEDLIPNEQVVVTMTSAYYIKRSPASEYHKQGRGGKGKRGMTTREEDMIQHLVLANTHDFLLFFTDKGRVFRLKTYEIPSAGLSAKGVAIANLLQLHPEEEITSIITHRNDDKEGFMFMCTKRGVVKKTSVEAYKNVRSSGLIAINLDEGDELKWVRFSSGDNEIVISTEQGQAIRFHESEVRSMGRVSRGVRGIRLRKDDIVVGMGIVQEDANIFVISENGYGKRTKVAQFTPHKRGGVGIRSAVVNAKTGKLMGVASLRDGDDQEIIIISKLGQTIRLGMNDVPEIGRATQGVRIMRLKDGDCVASMGLIKREEETDSEDKGADDVKVEAKVPKSPTS